MKIHNKVLGVMVSAVLLTGGSLVYAQADHNHTSNKTTQHQSGKMMSNQMNMHDMHKKMQEHMKKMDTEMLRLMSAIDAAKGEDKVNLMADMLRKMVNHRQMMHKKMGHMHQQMKGHMMNMHQGKMENHSKMKNMNNSQHEHQQ